MNLSTSPIDGPAFSGPAGLPINVSGTYYESYPRSDRPAKQAFCHALIPPSGQRDCELTFDIDCRPPINSTTLAPTPRNSDPQSNLWVNALDLANATPPNTITETFNCSDPDDTLAQSDVLVCGPTVLSLGVHGPITTPAVEGKGQLFPAFAIDLVGNDGSKLLILNVDETPPSVQTASIIPQPNGDGWNNSPSVTVTFAANDQPDLSGLVPGLSRTVLNGVTTLGLTRTVSGEGVYDIAAFAADYAGNQGSMDATVRIDMTAPAISIISPTDGQSVSATMIDVVLNASDGLSGIDASQVKCAVDLGHGPTVYGARSSGGGQYTCQGVALAQGSATITATAVDNAANQGRSPAVRVFCPTCPPQ